MKRISLRGLALMAPALLLCSGIARGEDASSYYAGSNSDGRYLSVADSKQVVNDDTEDAGGCNSCGGCDSCGSCCDHCDLDAFCEECPESTSIWFTNFESWRGIADGSFQNNDGIRSGVNYGRLLRDSRLGFQAGASYGAYDFMGRQSGGGNEPTAVQEQYFVTTGFFRRADCESPWSAGLVYDWMINDNFGVFSNEPFLGQWRGQVAYAADACNEYGVWGTMRDRGDNTGAREYRAVQQYNLFWHHKWACADSWVWGGILDTSDDLSDGEGLGEFTLGGSIIAPISDCWALTGDLQYMKPSAEAGFPGDREYAFFVSFGISYYPGGNARTRTVAGGCSQPYMPVANNGNFLTDTDLTN